MRVNSPLTKILTGILLMLSVEAYGSEWVENSAIRDLFYNHQIEGTFVVYDSATQRYLGYNKARAEQRFVPASTFKIVNSLIALSVGAVKSVDEIIPYNGPVPALIRAWEKDMSLREAIVVSNVPIYQEIARRIGQNRMKDNLVRIGFGNNETGPHVDKFWLDGPLQINAIEQTQFLVKLANGTLPYSPEIQDAVQEITLLTKGRNWHLHGKTGWQNAPGTGVGWWVGWLEKEGNIYGFALNMEVRDPSDADKRVDLGRKCLQELGLLEK